MKVLDKLKLTKAWLEPSIYSTHTSTVYTRYSYYIDLVVCTWRSTSSSSAARNTCTAAVMKRWSLQKTAPLTVQQFVDKCFGDDVHFVTQFHNVSG